MNCTIWTYWDDNNTNTDLLDACKRSWIKYCPNWKINFLNNTNFTEFVTLDYLPKNFEELSPVFKSDILRLYLLYNFGGLWLDRSYELLNDISRILDSSELNSLEVYYGFFHHDTIPESHFLYTFRPGNPGIGQWLNTLIDLAKYAPIFSDSPVFSINLESFISLNPNYFMIYAAYDYCQKTIENFETALPLKPVFEFYGDSLIIPKFPFLGQTTLPSIKMLFGKNTMLYKYTNKCRFLNEKSKYLFILWLIIIILLYVFFLKKIGNIFFFVIYSIVVGIILMIILRIAFFIKNASFL